MMNADVVIIGAGPAGIFTALLQPSIDDFIEPWF